MFEIILVSALALALSIVTAPIRTAYAVLMAVPRGMARKFQKVIDYPGEVRLARHDTLMHRIPRGYING